MSKLGTFFGLTDANDKILRLAKIMSMLLPVVAATTGSSIDIILANRRILSFASVNPKKVASLLITSISAHDYHRELP